MKLRQGIIKMRRETAWIKLKGRENPQCLFRHNKILIGVVVLASFGFEVDPATVKLKTSAFVSDEEQHSTHRQKIEVDFKGEIMRKKHPLSEKCAAEDPIDLPEGDE